MIPALRHMGGRPILPAKSAPRDGSRFIGIRKGGTTPREMLWDSDMRCFWEFAPGDEDFSLISEISCWLGRDQ